MGGPMQGGPMQGGPMGGMQQGPPRVMTPASGPAARRQMMYGDLAGRPGAPIDDMFPEDERGVSMMELESMAPPGLPPGVDRGQPPGWNGPGSTSQPPQRGTGPRSRSDDMRTIRQGLGLPPDGSAAAAAAAMQRQQAAPWAGGSPPGPPMMPPGRPMMPSGPQQMMPPGPQQMMPPGPQMMPPGPQMMPPRDPFPPPPGRMPAAARPMPGRDPRVRQVPILSASGLSRLPLAVYALIGLLVVGGSVLAGFKVRSVRLDGQIDAARVQADRAAESDTYTGYLIAIDGYRRIADAADDLESQAAHAAISARMTAEVGDGLDQARRLVAALGQETDLADALAARGFLAVAEEDAVRASKAAVGLRQVAPEHPDALYLAGRAALLSEKPGDAAQLLRAALEKTPRPAVAVALARAEAGQGRFPESRAALERAFKLRPQHPGATLWAARIAVWGKSFPTRAGEPEASLDALIQEAGKPPAQQAVGVSPGQAAWAALALAEVKLARGDRPAAQGALGAAQTAARGGLAFRSALAEMLVELGDLTAARAQVELTVKEWPASVAARLLEARVAMASGDPGSALAALDKAGDLAANPEGLTLRGRARLATGAVEQAAADLDAALALRGDQEGAVLARARVDLARGDARIARRRLMPLYGNGVAAPVEVVAAYVGSLRQSGDRAEARKTLAALAQNRPAEAGDWRILVEQARLARAESSFRAAADLYGKAIAAAPRALEARLESASLSLDLGSLAGAHTQLEEMVKEGTQSGPVLIEAARMRTLSGDHAGAGELLDRAGKQPGASWKLARERGRLLLRQRRPEQAVAELEKAKTAASDDGETRVLLMEAYLPAKNRRAAARELVDLTKRFRGTPVLALARGLEALTGERWRDAAEELSRAHEMAEEDGEPPRILGRAAYWTGRALYLDDKVSKAIDWLSRAVEHDPSLADAHYLLGQIAFENKSPDRMVKRFEKAVSIDPAGNPSAWFFLGENYVARRRYEQARQALQTYLDRWPEGDFATDARDLVSKMP
jgi:tetratricopeptide (TPR) repeat protein